MLKNYLETLNDETLKRLSLLYCDNSSLPFSKDKAIKGIVSFINKERMAMLLSKLNDNEILSLSVMFFCKEASFETLKDFTKLESPILLNVLFNLKQKLMIFEIKEKYFINEDIDEADIISYSALFSSEPSDKFNDVVSRNTIIGILNFFYSNPIPVHAAHTDKYLKSTTLTEIFPRFDSEKVYMLCKFIFARLLENAYFDIEDNHYILKAYKFKQFLGLNTVSLISYFLFNTINKDTVSFLQHLGNMELITSDKANEAIEKLKSLISFPYEISNQNLFLFNLITQDDGKLNFKVSYNDNYSAFVQINSDLSSFFQGELRLNSILPLIASAEKIDTLSIYSINKACITKALDYYNDIETIIKELQEDSKEIPPLVKGRLDSWFGSYSRLSFVSGIVMYTNETEAKILDSLPLLQIHIKKRLAPTVYLMKKDTVDQWRRILFYAGFENLGEIRDLKTESEESIENYEVANTIKESTNNASFCLESSNDTLNKDEQLIVSAYGSNIITEKQFKRLKEVKLTKVNPFDVRAKVNVIEQLYKEKGMSAKISLFDEDFEAIVLNCYKENNIPMTVLYNLEKGTEITVPISKIYTIYLI